MELFSSEEITGKPLEESYPWMKNKKFVCVRSSEEVKPIVDAAIASGLASLDLETSGLDTRVYDGKCNIFIAGFCISYDGETGYYIPVNHGFMDDGVFVRKPELCVNLEEIREEIQRLLDNCICIYHNSIYDHAVLEGNGFKIPEFANPEVKMPVKIGKKTVNVRKLAWEDTLCLAYLWDSSIKNKGLKNLSETRLGMKMIELKELFQEKGDVMFHCLDPHAKNCTAYACSDAICTYLLFKFLKHVKEEQAFIYYVELRCSISTREMGKNFSRVDIDKAKRFKSLLLSIQDDVQRDANTLLKREINLASPQQVGEVLVNEFKIDVTAKNDDGTVKKSDKGKVSYETGVDELLPYAKQCPFVDLVLTYRDINKTVGTYLNNFIERVDENGEVRFKFQQWLVETGRFSCSGGEAYEGYSGVNIQALTKPLKEKDKKNEETGQLYTIEELVRLKGSGFFLRSCIIPRPGSKIVAIDYSGQELRVAANISNEKIWIDEFLNGKGDLHTETAKVIFHTQTPDEKMRDICKVVNFQTLYGGGPKALSDSLGISFDEAKDFQQKMLGGLKQLKAWMERTKKRAHETKYAETPLGRRRKLFGIDSQDRMEVSKAERNAINTPVQGTGGDMMKLAMVLVREYIAKIPKDEVRMLFTVHDELVFEIKEDKLDTHIPELMNIMSLETVLHKTLGWPVAISMDCEVGSSWEVEYEYFKKNPKTLEKLIPTLQFAKCRSMGYDPKTLQAPPKKDEPKPVQSATSAPSPPAQAKKAPSSIADDLMKAVDAFGDVPTTSEADTVKEIMTDPAEVAVAVAEHEHEELEIINSDNFDPVALDKAISAFLISCSNKNDEIKDASGVDIQKSFLIGLSVYVRTVKKEIIPHLEKVITGESLTKKMKNYPESYQDYCYTFKGEYDNYRESQLDFMLRFCTCGITNYTVVSKSGDVLREGKNLNSYMFNVLAEFFNI
jgi:DNA polymerase I-like protein with 3'-5' exonuclease and polymerase domains